jgi:sugar (Glycoside-Pentoside-Hexuronide) transporter
MVTEPVTNNKDAIKWPEKIAYFCGNLGNIPVMSIIGTFLLIFYTDIVKLNPMAVGVLFLIARIFDSVLDPLIGFMIDHLPRTKMGRFRPWLILGSFICSINFIVLWLGPSMAPTGKLVIAYISYLLLGPTFACMDISLNSLIPSMTESNNERGVLSTIKGYAYNIGYTGATMVVVPFVALFPTQKQGYHILIICVGIFVFALSLICGLGVKERVIPAKTEKYPFRTIFTIIFKSKPLLVMFIGQFFIMVGGFIQIGGMMYYFTYNVENPGLMVDASFVMLIASLVGVSLSSFMAKHLEKKIVMISCFLLNAVGCAALMPVSYHNTMLILAIIFVQYVGNGAFYGINYSIQADTVDYVEWKHGYRTEATVVSFNSFIIKLGQALGGAVPAFILSATGYAASAQTQNSSTLLGINMTMSMLPAVLIAIGALIYIAYPITHAEHRKIVGELDIRRKNGV